MGERTVRFMLATPLFLIAVAAMWFGKSGWITFFSALFAVVLLPGEEKVA